MDIDKVPSLEDAIVALTTTTRYMGSSLMGIALAVYIGREASPFVVGMVLAVYALGMTVFAPLVGAIADITGRYRLVLVSTGTIATVIAAVLALAESTWSIVAIRGAYAAFEVGFIPVMLTIISEKGGAETRGRSVGFFNSAVALGYFFGQLVSGALISVLPPIGVYAIITGLSGVATIAVGFVTTPNIVDTADNRRLSTADVVHAVRTRLSITEVFRLPESQSFGLHFLYSAVILRSMTIRGLLSLMPVFLTLSLGVSESLMGALIALNAASQVGFMHLFGRVTDRFGRKPPLIAGMVVAGFASLVFSVSVLPATLRFRVAIVIVGFLLIGASYSSVVTATTSYISDVAPAQRRSELLGFQSTAQGVGGIVGPPLVGLLATATEYETAFAVFSVLCFLAAFIVLSGLIESHPNVRAKAQS